MNINISYKGKAKKVFAHLPLYLFALLLLGLSSCSDDDITGDSIFTDPTDTPTAFDNWITENYTKPYNIRFLYRYNDAETENSYNVIPADVTKSEAIAILVKNVWLDAYAEVMGEDFVKENAPRIFQLIGSFEYDTSGSVVLGTAEGGVKITLFNVNAVDPNNIFIDQDSPIDNDQTDPIDLNYNYFHTIHHEFCHLLTQKKNYSTDFREISAGEYHTSDWINVENQDAPALGFVSGYASGEYNEDFAETYAAYVTKSDKGWQQLLNMALKVQLDDNGDTVYQVQKDDNGNTVYHQVEVYDPETDEYTTMNLPVYLTDANGNRVPSYDTTYRDKIVQKLELIRTYMRTQWNLDIDKLREVVLRRSKEAANLKLTIE